MPHDQQAIQQTKRNRWDDEQIHRRDAVGMIVEKCFPTLGRRPSTRGHIPGYAGMPNFDTEIEQLSMNPWNSPERIGDDHLADQHSYFERHRLTATAASRIPTPRKPKTNALPTYHFRQTKEPDKIPY